MFSLKLKTSIKPALLTGLAVLSTQPALGNAQPTGPESCSQRVSQVFTKCGDVEDIEVEGEYNQQSFYRMKLDDVELDVRINHSRLNYVRGEGVTIGSNSSINNSNLNKFEIEGIDLNEGGLNITNSKVTKSYIRGAEGKHKVVFNNSEIKNSAFTAYGNNFEFKGSLLADVEVSGVSDYDLTDTKLYSVQFQADDADYNITGAIIDDLYFTGLLVISPRIKYLNFSDSIVKGVSTMGARVTNDLSFNRTTFSNSDLSDMEVRRLGVHGNSVLSNVFFNESEFKEIEIYNSHLKNVDFSEQKESQHNGYTRVEDSKLTNVNFSNSTINLPLFQKVKMKNVYFANTRMLMLNQHGYCRDISFNYSDMRNIDLSTIAFGPEGSSTHCKDKQVQFTKTDLRGANIDNLELIKRGYFDGTIVDSTTVLPQGWDVEKLLNETTGIDYRYNKQELAEMARQERRTNAEYEVSKGIQAGEEFIEFTKTTVPRLEKQGEMTEEFLKKVTPEVEADAKKWLNESRKALEKNEEALKDIRKEVERKEKERKRKTAEEKAQRQAKTLADLRHQQSIKREQWKKRCLAPVIGRKHSYVNRCN